MVVGEVASRADDRPHRRLRGHRLHRPARRRAARRRGRAPGAGRPLAGAAAPRWRTGSAASRPRTATSCAATPCSRWSSEGDVLVSTVGPFAKWGEPAVRAAIAGRRDLPRLDRRAGLHPPRVREPRAAAERAGAALLTAMGYDFVPGALAGALALEEAGEDAVRVDVGYYALGMRRQTRQRRHARVAGRRVARREPRVPRRRAAHACGRPSACARSRQGQASAPAISVGGAEHFGAARPRIPQLREVNVYLGWFGPLARPMQAGGARRLGRHAAARACARR